MSSAHAEPALNINATTAASAGYAVHAMSIAEPTKNAHMPPSSWPRTNIYDTISTSYMVTEAPSTARARRLRERRSRGVVMVAPVEVGEGGVALLVSNGLLKEHQTRDRKAVAAACLAALEQWSMGRGARTVAR